MAVGLGVIPQFPASISTSDASILVSVANGIFDFKVNPNGTPSVAGVNFGTDVHAWKVRQKPIDAAGPVALFQPTALNSGMTIDLFPNGASPVSPYPDVGALTWIDMCDADLILNDLAPVSTFSLRNKIGAGNLNVMEIATIGANGGTVKPVTFTSANIEIFRYNGTGVGIGTSAPNGKLAVSSNATAAIPSAFASVIQAAGTDAAISRILNNAFGNIPTLDLHRANGTNAARTALANADFLGNLNFAGYDGANFNVTAAVIAQAQEAFTAAHWGTDLLFYTSQKLTNTIREVARITGTGGLSLGTTSDPGTGLMYLNSASFLMRNKTSWSNGAAAATGTLTNAPAAGNPTKWIPIDDNGTTRYIPTW